MKPEFWHERWREGRIGFHQPDFHPALLRHWHELRIAPGGRVFVPLCGRSLDMVWLRRQGHEVIGVELSPIAIAGFFEHEGLTARVSPDGPLRRHAAAGYELLEGDFFDADATALGPYGGWYDRAALIALPPELRPAYARHLAGLTAAGVPGLLITHDYRQERMSGPPFSVPVEEVHDLLEASFDIRQLERRDVLPDNPGFRERGLDHLMETAFSLVRR